MTRIIGIVTAFALGCVFSAYGETLSAVLARLDAAAPSFSGVTAQMTEITHTAVLNEDTTDKGLFRMQRHGKEVRALVDFSGEKDKRVLFFADRSAHVYYPNLNLVQVYDLGSQSKLIDEYLLLGFGVSGKDLQKAYNIQVLGTEAVNGKNTSRLELIPKDPATREQLVKAEIWIPEDSALPVQQKIYQKNGNFTLVQYSDLRLTPSSDKQPLKLVTPPGTKTEHPH